MPNDNNHPPKPESPAGERTNRPTTIDLKASEFRSETSATESQPRTSTAGEQKAEVPPRTATAGEKKAEPPPRGPDGSGGRVPPGDVRPSGKDGASDWPWSVIAMAAVAAIVFFAVGLAAGRWLFDREQEAQLALGSPPPEWLARLGRLEATVTAPRREDPQLLSRIAAAEAAAKTAADMAAARERRSDEIAAIARDARDRAAIAASAAEAAQKSGAATSDSRADVDSLVSRLAALEQAARSNQAEQARRASDASDDVRNRVAIATMALRNAVESGAPFAAELAAVKSLSADARSVAALEPFAAAGIPTAPALGRELSALMPSLWKAARAHETPEGTFLERLQANAEKIVRVRPAGEIGGDDPAQVKARIEARASQADIQGALAELAKLPPEARAPAQAWIARAEARNAALAAARALSQNALNALAKTGS